MRIDQRLFAATLLAFTAIAAITTIGTRGFDSVRDRSDYRPASTVKVDNLEATGTIHSSGQITAASGVALTDPGGAWIRQVTSDPSGALVGVRGSLALRNDTAALYQNQNNGTTWKQLATTDVFTAVAAGLAPASGGGTSNFLRADGSWAAPGGATGGTAPSFGVGYDGDCNFNGTATVCQQALSGSVYASATRDYYYDDLTIANGFAINPGGNQIYVAGTVSGTGTIQRNGTAGSGATGGAAPAGVTLPGGSAGGAGTTGGAAPPAATTAAPLWCGHSSAVNGTGGASQNSGTSASGVCRGGGGGGGGTGAGAAAQSVTVRDGQTFSNFAILSGRSYVANVPTLYALGGGGGGGGGGGTSNVGGGGGSTGGWIHIAAANCGTGTWSVSARGGNGANGTCVSAGGGGGGGGSGGYVMIFCHSGIAPIPDVSGGAGGSGATCGTTGGNGGNGAPGYYRIYDPTNGWRTNVPGT